MIPKSNESPKANEKITVDALRPLDIQLQSCHFKNSIFPELHGEKRYFKAAQTMLISD